MIQLKKLNIIKEVASELAARKLEERGYQRMKNEDTPKEPMKESKEPTQEDKLPTEQPPTAKQPKKAEKGKKEQKEDEQGGSEDDDTGLHQSNDPSRTNQADNSGGNGQQ